MNLDFGLRLTQEQKLIMTMQMQLSVKVLQMSSYELLQHINKELQENIVLESANDNITLGEVNEQLDHKELIKYLEFDNYSSKSYNTSENYEEVSPLYFIGNKKTLKDYLTEQLIDSALSNKQLKICKFLVDNLDDRGYLECSLEVICKSLHITMESCEECLNIVQSLDPCGICARNLTECLLLQVERKGINEPYLKEMISNYLPLLSENKFAIISKKIGITPLEVQKLSDVIRTLEPKPARGFSTGEDIGYIVPDAYIRKINNEYLILMNDSIIPKLNINKIYKEVINFSEDKVAVDYVKDKINNAVFLIKSIENRKNTLLRVLQEIVNFQFDYFEYGDKYLKPMTIKQIANNLELHESTISRAIRDKYIALNDGKIKRIKELFTNSLNIKNEELSTIHIKNMVKEIIEKEDKKKTLSDSTICEILNDKGVNISRRTVAKYREELNIKSSTQRKRL